MKKSCIKKYYKKQCYKKKLHVDKNIYQKGKPLGNEHEKSARLMNRNPRG